MALTSGKYPGYDLYAIEMECAHSRYATLDDFKELVLRIDSSTDGGREMIHPHILIADGSENRPCVLIYSCYLKCDTPMNITIASMQGIQPGDTLTLTSVKILPK